MTSMKLPGRPFAIATEQSVLDDLADRLRRTRFSSEQISPSGKYGVPLDYAHRLRDRWLNSFRWRDWETKINAFNQRMVTVDNHDIHVVIEPVSGEAPLPLFLTHGWPGSFLEFIDIIEPLAHPERFGGRVEDAFSVIIPSLPGYGYSPAPTHPVHWQEISALWSKLAIQHFKFPAYAAQGGDWGSVITANLALNHLDRLVGIHLSLVGLAPCIDERSLPLSEEEIALIERAKPVMQPESGYQIIQGTKSQSLAYAHSDSPIGLACWIIEKFHGWTTPSADSDPPFEMDQLLANIMLYWINGSNAPSWLYTFVAESDVPMAHPGARVNVPAAFTPFPKDMAVPPPRSWAEQVFDVHHYTVQMYGGHFTAMENGELLNQELRRFFAPIG